MEDFDIFREDLIRGVSGTENRPEKRALYVEDKETGIRVYIRVVVFIHNLPTSFLVVKTTWRKSDDFSWEPPKGGVEGKDIGESTDLLSILENAVRRETLEEAKISHLDNLHYSGYFFQGKEKEYDNKTFFQYHIFQATVRYDVLNNARKEFEYYRNNREAWDKLPKECKEKNSIGFFRSDTKIAGRWSPTLVDFYLKNVLKM